MTRLPAMPALDQASRLLVALSVVTGCSDRAAPPSPTEPAPSPRPSAASPPTSSSRAVVLRGASWVDGVFGDMPGRVVVEGEEIVAAPTQVARIGVSSPRVGEPLLGWLDPDGAVSPARAGWHACRVRRVRAGGTVVEDTAANLYTLPPARLARPLDPTSIGRTLGRAAAGRSFDAQVARERARAPADWNPAKGEAVVVRLVDAHLGATVLAVEGDARVLRVRFADPDLSDRDVPQADVVPATSTPVEQGDLALLRPADASLPWPVVRVRRGGATPRVEARDGETRDVPRASLRSFALRSAAAESARGSAPAGAKVRR